MWIQEAFWVVALLAAIGWFFQAYLKPIGGQWHLENADEPHWDLMQVGPWVFGEQRKANGIHKFSGRLKGGVWHISRRDLGRALFEAQGFPELIAHQLSGRVMVTYRLTVRPQAKVMEGQMMPMKVVFVKVPLQISEMIPESPKPVLLTKKQPL
ncbi:MAG: hypothetical protein CMH56_16445 [Myxococcales bacterium]|nr:hypothetical protein [Myxococcales bacterium]|tara:strand:+ start:2711 stop:3172 length:462 start_codon:yes stop_codon:yes gene_type:complete